MSTRKQKDYKIKQRDFWGHIPHGVTEDGCWEWQGDRKPDGYGQYAGWGAHRLAYVLVFGPLPSWLHIDHLCRNRACVNPAHLEPVRPAENIARGITATRNECAKGHPYTPENTRYDEVRKQRVCKTCARMRSYESRLRKAAGKPPIKPAPGFCLKGHALDEENTYVAPSGKRTCRQCRRENARRARLELMQSGTGPTRVACPETTMTEVRHAA